MRDFLFEQLWWHFLIFEYFSLRIDFSSPVSIQILKNTICITKYPKTINFVQKYSNIKFSVYMRRSFYVMNFMEWISKISLFKKNYPILVWIPTGLEQIIRIAKYSKLKKSSKMFDQYKLDYSQNWLFDLCKRLILNKNH